MKNLMRVFLLGVSYISAWIHYDASASFSPDLPFTVAIAETFGISLDILSWVSGFISIATFGIVMLSFKG